MRKKLIFLGMLTTFSGSLKATDYGYLVFTLNDGTTQSIVTTNLSLTFNGGNVTAKSDTSTLVIPLANLQKMEFSDDNTADIHETEEFGQSSALTIDESTEIFDLQGIRVTKDQMRNGIYIVKRGNKTYKMTVK